MILKWKSNALKRLVSKLKDDVPIFSEMNELRMKNENIQLSFAKL